MNPWLAKLLRTQWFYLMLLTVVLSALTAWKNPLFLRVTNIESILKQISVLCLVATGATILIVSGNFDISVGAVIGLAGCVMGMLILSGVHVVWAVAAGVALSVVCALVVGGASILLRAPSFIVSLACIDFDWKAMGNDWAEYIAKHYPGENIAMVPPCTSTSPARARSSTSRSCCRSLR